MVEHLYGIHGVGLRLSTESPAIASAGQTLLRHFRQETLDTQGASVFIFTAAIRKAKVDGSLTHH